MRTELEVNPEREAGKKRKSKGGRKGMREGGREDGRKEKISKRKEGKIKI